MPATSRFVLFDPDAETTVTGNSSTDVYTGTRGYVESASGTSDTITITTGSADSMRISVDGGAFQPITLTSGTAMDTRTVARDIAFQIHKIAGSQYEHVQCEFVNSSIGNVLRIYSSSLGASSVMAVDNGLSNDCLHLLGMALWPILIPGSAHSVA